MKKAFFAIFLFIFHQAYSQQFGGNPSSIQWQQINTDVVRVIYPKGLDSIAERIASITHYLQKNYSQTIGDKLRKINIILQSNTSVTNGYVALAPYRSEFYLTPPQNAFELGAQNWGDNLSIHEFRHVQQYSNFNRGWSKTLSYFLGEQGQDLGNAASIPNWFFEGDAVYNETLLSHQGRGRLPSFLAGYRSIFDLNKHYTYMQLRNGSLQHLIPDHYPIGYMLVAYGREKYGINFWRKVTEDASAFHPLFYPFQNAVKKYSGVSFTKFVKDAFDFYHDQWRDDTLKQINWITPVEKNNVIDYKYPYLMQDGSLLLLRDSYTDIPHFVIKRPDSTEKVITVRDIAVDDYFSYNNNKIIYGAFRSDTRWGYRDYSVIKLYDIQTGTTKTIDNKTKYFSPDISHDGKMIVTVKMEPGLKASIVLLSPDGKILNEWSNKNAVIYSYPKFSSDDQFIYEITRDNRGGMGIEKRKIADGSVTVVLNSRNRILGYPVVQGDTLLYTCSNNGYDEIWAYVERKHQDFRLARYATGLYQAVFTGNRQLVASAFTADGYRLGAFNASWQAAQPGDTLTNLYVTTPFKDFDNNTLVTIRDSTYPIEKYPKSTRLVNFHSFRPFFDYPNSSIIVYGQNVLYTLQSELYYTHNNNEGYNQFGYSGIFGGTYAEPVLNVSQTYNRQAAFNQDTTVNWNEFNISGGLELPFNFSEGRQYRTLTLTSTYNYNHVDWQGIAKTFLPSTGFTYLQNRLEYVGQSQIATKQIYPSWAQVITLQYRGSLDKTTAHQLLASSLFYLPGLSKTNSTVIALAYQARDTAGQYFYTNDFPIARGYREIDFPRMWKAGINYHFPLAYPDWGFANLAFVQRVRANVFFDYSAGKSLRTGNIYNFNSFGAELFIDGKIWNEQPVTIGARYSRLINGGGGLFELVAPILIIN